MPTNQHTRAVFIPKGRRWGGRNLCVAAAAAGSFALCWALSAGFPSVQFRSRSVPAPATVEVDRGDVAVVVTENGSLESSVDDVVRCRVESFLGLPVGAPPAATEPRPSRTRSATIRGAGGSWASGSRDTTIAAVKKAKTVARSQSVGSPGTVKNDRPRAGSASKPQGNAAVSGLPTALSFSGSAAPSDSGAAPTRPLIRSFDYIVEPHLPLRSTLPDQGVISTGAPSPPTILSILPEGSRVKAGDIVCELDSSAFQDALVVQKLRHVQAKAWVEQARYALEAERIALREYEAGILPQDIELVRQNIGICQIEREQATRNLAWARAAFTKGFRTESQVNADASMLEQTQIALRDAEGMLEQLVKYTGKRIQKARKAKLQAIQADLLSLESSFRLETERLKRIQAMIANCTMRAPGDGIIVYATQSNGWGTVETEIREGLFVHPSQPIFRLLDPRHMQVRARINESQVARIRPGQRVLIHLEAFPDHPLRGSVAEIVPIPSPDGNPFSDVRSFYATVRIESGGFDALTTGLSAELEFLVETRRRVPRVPLEAIRWVGERSFAATVVSTTTGLDWRWTPIALGVTDTSFAEVVKGLAPGDRVIAHAESLPATDLGPPDPKTNLDLALARSHPPQ